MSLVKDYYLADYQYELLCNNIKDFQNGLDDEHELALLLTSFGQYILLKVTDLGYSNPSLIHFYGYVNDTKAHLIQHVNQLNFLITSVPKSDPNKPARRIGFEIKPASDV